MNKTMAIPLVMFFTILTAPAQNAARKDPYSCLSVAQGKSLKVMRSRIVFLKSLNNKDAEANCAIAELLKRTGDYGAEEYYKKAIEANPDEPAYELFFADYLRNFRGAQHPLFPQAEEHYFEALRKLKLIKNREPFDNETERRIERGMVALYQEDGLPLAYSKSSGAQSIYLQKPHWFLSSINKFAEATTDFDRVDDSRSFTSEALFASSADKLKRPLTTTELKQILRTKNQYETLTRSRFRYGSLPVFDVFYKYRNINDAQITNFSKPNEFNDIHLHEYGISVEKPFDISPYFDFFLRGAVKKINREGLVEFLPTAKEDVNQFETNAVLSRFVGPDKANLEATYVYQDINQKTENPPTRNRTILAAKFTYQVFRPLPFLRSVYENRFETRGLDLFGGVLRDKENFGGVAVRKNDFFFGASLKGMGSSGKIDVTVQPAVFTGSVDGDKSQKSTLYRTNANLLYRWVDEEAHPGVSPEGGALHLAFLHLVIPFSHDISTHGLNSYENVKIGIALNSKFFTTGLRRTSFLLSARYDYQRFYKLAQNRNLVTLNFSMGF